MRRSKRKKVNCAIARREIAGKRKRNLQLQKIGGSLSPPTSTPQQRGATAKSRGSGLGHFFSWKLAWSPVQIPETALYCLVFENTDARSGDHLDFLLLVLSPSGQLEASRGCHRHRLIGPRSVTLINLSSRGGVVSTELRLPTWNEPSVHPKISICRSPSIPSLSRLQTLWCWATWGESSAPLCTVPAR